MKSKMMTMGVAGLALAASAFLVTPSAWAAANTPSKVSTVSVSTTAHYTFMRGLDNNIWYTLSSSVGSIKANTGNTTGNPFDVSGVSFTGTGFVSNGTTFCSSNPAVGTVAGVVPAAGGICSGNFVKFPGVGSFTDGPHASLFGPIASSTYSQAITGTLTGAQAFPYLPASREVLINIVAPGLGGNIYYTLYDGSGTTGNATAINGGSQVSLPAGDPFAFVGEANNSGFVTSASTGLETVCQNSISPTRTCFGIWAPYP